MTPKQLIKQHPTKTRAQLLNLPEVYNNPKLFQELLFMTDQEFEATKVATTKLQQQKREYHQTRFATITLLQEIKQLLQEIRNLLEANK
jgi:hypothetical protein